MQSVQAAIYSMHAAGISQSQIEHGSDTRSLATVQAARAGLKQMAAAVGARAIPAKAASAFMAAFLDTEHKLACSIVERFSNELRNEQQVRRFLGSVRKYVRVFLARRNFQKRG